MIGGIGSSVATAIRTAGQARERMDTAARQIATGQRVASVRDDAAAWTRAAGIASDRKDWEARRTGLDRAAVALEFTAATIERTFTTLDALRDLVLAARGTLPGSEARRNLQVAWAEAVQTSATPDDVNPGFEGMAGYAIDALGIGVQLSAIDPFFSGTRFAAYPDLAAWGNWFTAVANPAQNRPAQLSTVNLETATSAQLDDVMTTINTLSGVPNGGWAATWAVHNGGDRRQVESLKADVDAQLDRLDAARGSLLDADLGAASSALRQNEARQQLALSTVRQALDAYGAFAGGLLGNVQRTQRSVLA